MPERHHAVIGPWPFADELLGLDEPGWRRLTAGTPLRRLDAARLARNLDAVLANRSAALEPTAPTRFRASEPEWNGGAGT
jgi:hypothetical protein